MALPFFPQYFDNRNRTFKARNQLDSLTEYEVRKHCGIPRQAARDLYDIMEPYVTHPTQRGHATPAETQFLTALSFFRSGSFQYVEGSVGGVSQSTISRIIERFSANLVRHLLPQYLKFSTDAQHMNTTKAQYFEMASIPNICGLVDGTHIVIKPPKGPEEYAYVNRKLKHSINVQVRRIIKNMYMI